MTIEVRISYAITAYNEMGRGGPTILESMDAALSHPDINEVVVTDDMSDADHFHWLQDLMTGIDKVKLYRNNKNLGVFGNKLAAVANTSGDWVINSDSDNVISREVIDLVLDRELDPKVWYSPSFAKPQFDYRPFVGSYDASTIGDLVAKGGMTECFINTGNQTVNRKRYLEVFGKYLGQRADLLMPNYLDIPEGKRADKYWADVFNACDSLIFNMEWLKSGGKLEIVEGFEYDHFYTSGDDSNYNRAPGEKGKLNEILVGMLKSGVMV